jgi:hypothetical protein
VAAATPVGGPAAPTALLTFCNLQNFAHIIVNSDFEGELVAVDVHPDYNANLRHVRRAFPVISNIASGLEGLFI